MSEDSKDDTEKTWPQADEEGLHTDYKPADIGDGEVRHRLNGMYQNWFLDYASYVILSGASCTPCAAWKTGATTKWPTSWAKP